MGGYAHSCCAEYHAADIVCGFVSSQTIKACGIEFVANWLFKWAHRIPKVWLTAAYAAVPCLDRPACVLVKAKFGAVVESIGTFAAHFIKAVAFLRALIAKGFYKLSRIKASAPLAQIVDSEPISPSGAIIRIEAWERAKEDEVQYIAHDVFLARWAARDIYHGFISDF